RGIRARPFSSAWPPVKITESDPAAHDGLVRKGFEKPMLRPAAARGLFAFRIGIVGGRIMDSGRLFERYRELQSYVGWTESDVQRIIAAAPLVEPSFRA